MVNLEFLKKMVAPPLWNELPHSVFETVYVAVYDKLNSSKPWVYDVVYETLCFGLKLHKIFKLLDILLLSDIWVNNLI